MTEARLEENTRSSPKDQGGLLGEPPKYWPTAPTQGTGELLTLTEIERRYGVREYWVYKWADEGRLHVVRDGKRFKYPDWEVRELLRSLYGALGAAA